MDFEKLSNNKIVPDKDKPRKMSIKQIFHGIKKTKTTKKSKKSK